MRIIRSGSAPREKLYRTTCNKCTTEFEFKKFEAETVFDQRDGDYLKITCPLENCGNLCYVQL